MDVVGEFFAKLCDDPGEKRADLIEVIIVCRIAVDASDADALEKSRRPAP